MTPDEQRDYLLALIKEHQSHRGHGDRKPRPTELRRQYADWFRGHALPNEQSERAKEKAK